MVRSTIRSRRINRRRASKRRRRRCWRTGRRWAKVGLPRGPKVAARHRWLTSRSDTPEILILIPCFRDARKQKLGTYFILYDFIEYFEKDGPSYLQRDKYQDIINTIFRNMSTLERDAIVFQYTDWEHVNDGYLNQKMIGDVVGDYFFICPTNHFAQVAAERGMKVYYYFFTHRTSTSLWGEWMGVMHGDEIEYVFGHPLNMSLQYNSRERELSLKMMQVFARFSATGKPVTDDVNWPLYTKDHPQYFIFNADKSGIGKGPRATACAFWNDFLPKLRDGQGSGETPCEASVVGAVASLSSGVTSSISVALIIAFIPALNAL